MSFQAQTAACALRGLKPLDKYLLMTLANYADADGRCYPSQRLLAEDTGLTDRSVRGHLDTLQTDGFITREQRRRSDGSRASDLITLTFIKRKDVPVAGEPTGTSFRGVGNIVPGGAEGGSGLTTFEPVIQSVTEPITPSMSLAENDNRVALVLTPPPTASPKRRVKAKLDPTAAEQEAFDAFWRVYPRKDAKKLALEAYVAAIRPGQVAPAEILAGARVYAELRNGQDPQRTKLPAGWLNDQRWTDETAAAPAGTFNDNRPRNPMDGFSAVDQAIDGFPWANDFEPSPNRPQSRADRDQQAAIRVLARRGGFDHPTGKDAA